MPQIWQRSHSTKLLLNAGPEIHCGSFDSIGTFLGFSFVLVNGAFFAVMNEDLRNPPSQSQGK